VLIIFFDIYLFELKIRQKYFKNHNIDRSTCHRQHFCELKVDVINSKPEWAKISSCCTYAHEYIHDDEDEEDTDIYLARGGQNAQTLQIENKVGRRQGDHFFCAKIAQNVPQLIFWSKSMHNLFRGK
jgi:hypothetical protein